MRMQNHQSTLPTIKSGHFSRAMAATFDDPCTVSPCRQRPDTGGPCRLLREHKNNRICQNCGFIPGKGIRGPGGAIRIWTNSEIEAEIKNGLLDPDKDVKDYKQDLKYRKLKNISKKYKCGFPGCSNEIIRGRYCTPHGKLVWERLNRWRKVHGEDSIPADSYLFQPKIPPKQRRHLGCHKKTTNQPRS